MANLENNQIKETYQQLLTLSSNNVTTSLKEVQDGAGTATALELSTTTVKVDGALEVSGQSTLTGALNSNGVANIDGGMNIGSAVQFTSVPANDAALYDALVLDSNGNVYRNSSLFVNDVLVARLDPDEAGTGQDTNANGTDIATSPSSTQLHFMEVDNSTNSHSHVFGNDEAWNGINGTPYNANRDQIKIATAGNYRIDVNINFKSENSGSSRYVTIYLEEKSPSGSFEPPFHTTTRSKDTADDTNASYSVYRYFPSDSYSLRVNVSASTGGIYATPYTTITVTRMS